MLSRITLDGNATGAGTSGALAIAVALCLLWSLPALGAGRKYCTYTARGGYNSCVAEAKEELNETKGICHNISDDDERRECWDDSRADLSEARSECREQRGARLDLCDALGQGRYDPDFDPNDFAIDFATPAVSNPYLPLKIGNLWVYEGGDETITVEVLNKTKLIEGVTCVVVRDVAEEDGDLIEDTDDWQAQALNGAVHYCGEISQEFETFDGDVPLEPELLGTEGSWKTGRDGAKPGILMQADPEPGQVYRQEWAFLEAEDAAEVLSDSYSYGVDAALDANVPAALAQALCNGDCVVTRDFTPIEPDASERKYYAPGIGLFLEVDEESGDAVELVSCNLPACGLIP
jgi:hypothetical protein